MANVKASIDVIVNGGSQIDQIINKAAQLEGIVNSLNKTPLDLSVKKATSEFDKFDTNLKVIKEQINQQQKALDAAGNSIDKYSDLVASTQRQLSTLNPNTKKYNEVLERQRKAVEGLTGAQKDLASVQQNLEDQAERLTGARKAAGRAKSAKLATEALANLADEYLRLGSAQEKGATGQVLKNQSQSTIARITAQANALKLVADNSEIASSQFNRFTIASQLASQKIYEGRQKKLNALAFGLSEQAPKVNIGTGGKSSLTAARSAVDTLIASSGGVVRSEAALSSYIDQLKSLQSLVPYLSEEYGKLERAIGDVSVEMESLQKMTQLRGATSKIQPQAGPASLLPKESVKSASEQAKYYQKRNDYQERLLGVEERISQANLNTLQKTELRTRLDKALGLLAENRLDDAKRETIELEKQRMSLERMNRAQKPLTFGALGTGFSPVSGELPSGKTIAGSPAAKLLLRKETENAVALAQQKMREEERIIADAWKMRGGPELPPGFAEAGKVQQRGGVYRTGQFSPVDGQKRLNNALASGAIIEQGLINLQGKGVNVTKELQDLQQSLNGAKQKEFDISIKNLDALNQQISAAGSFAQLQNKILAGQPKGAKAKDSSSGLEVALQRMREARGASKAFLGGASPAEAIDKIVREFNTGRPANNVTSTFAEEIQSGAGQMVSAAQKAFISVVEAIKDVFGIASPSRVMKEIAENLISSFITELISNIPSVKSALEKTFDPKSVGFEQPGRRFPRGQAPSFQLDPAYLAALSGQTPTPGRPAPTGIFPPASAPRVGALGSAFPFQSYNLATTSFPSDPTAQLRAGRNRSTDANRVLSEAIAEYRSAIDNFWNGEDSQFQAIKRLVVSATRLSAAQSARRMRQVGDITQEQQFQQVAREARSRISANRQPGIPGAISAVGDWINGDLELGVTRSVTQGTQRIFDSVLNGIEALAFSVSNSFGDGMDRLRGMVPGAISRGLSAAADAIDDFRGFGGFGGGGGGGGSAAGGGSAGGNAVSRTAQLLGFGDIADISRVSTRELEGLSAAASELRAILNPTVEGFDRLDDQLRETIGKIDRQLQQRDPNADFLTRRIGPRAGRAVSEGLVGGAFPLLFGQGLGASLFGGLGGAAGGLAGGGLGFGLSLLGTGLGSAFDTLAQAAKDTGKALRDPITGFEDLKKANLLASKSQEYYIEKLIEAGRFAQANAIIQSEIVKKIGANGIRDLNNLSKASDDLGKAWAELNLQLQAALAGPMTRLLRWTTEIVGTINKANQFSNQIKTIQQGLSPEQLAQFNKEWNQAAVQPYKTTQEQMLNEQSIIAKWNQKVQQQTQAPTSGAPMTPELLVAQQKISATTEQLKAQVGLAAKSLTLAGMTLEKDGQRYVLASKDVAKQEYLNKLLEIRNNWIGQIFNKEQNIAQIRAANLQYAAQLKQIDTETARRQEEVASDSLRADLAIHQQRQETIALMIRIAEFQKGEAAGLEKQLSLSDHLYRQKLTSLFIEKQLAVAEAAKNGTVEQTIFMYDEKLRNLEQEKVLEDGITKQKLAQLQLNKFIAIEDAKRQAIDPFAQFRQLQQLDEQHAKTYYRLLKEGIEPAEARRLADFDRLVTQQIKSLDIQIAIAQSVYDEAVQRGIIGQQLQDYLDNLDKLKKARDAATEDAQAGPGPAPEKIKGAKIQEFINDAEAKLKDLESVAINISQGIGDAVGNSLATGITGLIEGTTTAKDIFANFLKDVGQILIQEATKMIAIYVALAIARQFAGLLGGGSETAKNFEMPGEAFIPKGGFKFPGAADGAYFTNGVAAFAKGGMFTNSIVSSPTLFKFADGGSVRTGLMGEAGPEAIMPLQRGADGKLGVSAKLDGAMTRYGRPQRGMAAGAAAVGGGTSEASAITSQEPIDVRYSVERINNVDYVTADQFQAGMQQAAAQGAQRGEQRALRSLQQSTAVRSRVGMR